MKAFLLTVLAFAASSSAMAAADPAAHAAAKTRWTLVKVTDRDSKESFQVLDTAGLASLHDEIKKEERLYDKAMILTEKAWKADESTKTKMFPRSAIGHRSCEPTGSGNPFASREAADKAMAAAEDRVSQAEKSAEEAKKKHDENMSKAVGTGSSYQPKKKDPKTYADRKRLEELARSLFSSKLTELQNPPRADAKDAPPAGGNAAGAKPDVKAAGAAGVAGVGGMKK